MTDRTPNLLRGVALAGLLVLSACGRGEDANLAALDNELMANGADPALTSALEDQILVDPNLVQQSHPNSVRPPETPVQAQYPAGADPTRPQGRGAGGCAGANYAYGPQWAGRLPAAFPLYPGARVTEAAGSSDGNCRVVTFATADPYPRVLEHYRSLAARGGYSAEAQVRGADHVLGGVNEGTDGAYYLIVTPKQNGSDVALIVNNGR